MAIAAGKCRLSLCELKVDRKFVDGCTGNRLKQVICHRILELAADCAARAVAEDIETEADFLAVREMGFDVVQGFLFANPMSARKFARTMLGAHTHLTGVTKALSSFSASNSSSQVASLLSRSSPNSLRRDSDGSPKARLPLWVQKLWGRRQRSGTVVVVRKPVEVPP